MESVINEIEFNFEQTVSIRTDVKLSKDDVKQIVSEAPAETLEEIVYQSLVTDELYLGRGPRRSPPNSNKTTLK